MRKIKNQAFSLVEVTLALGVVAFAFLAILGLIPAGMGTFRQAINTSVCAQIGQRVIADAFQADYDTLLTPPSSSQTEAMSGNPTPFQASTAKPGDYRYFDEEGNEIQPTGNGQMPQNAIYMVNTVVNPVVELPGTTKALSQTALVTVQVIFNPGHYNFGFPGNSSDFTNLLLTSTTKIPRSNVYTYYAHVTRS